MGYSVALLKKQVLCFFFTGKSIKRGFNFTPPGGHFRLFTEFYLL